MNQSELFKLAKSGDQKAIYKIIDDNIGLIIYTINKLNISLDKKEDALQEGIIGIMKAWPRIARLKSRGSCQCSTAFLSVKWQGKQGKTWSH